MRWGRQGWALKPELGERRLAWCLSVHLPVNPFDRLSSPPPRLHFLLESDRGSTLLPPPPGVPSHKAFTVSHVSEGAGGWPSPPLCRRGPGASSWWFKQASHPRHPSSALAPLAPGPRALCWFCPGLGLQPFASSCLFLGGWPGASCQRWGEFVPMDGGGEPGDRGRGGHCLREEEGPCLRWPPGQIQAWADLLGNVLPDSGTLAQAEPPTALSGRLAQLSPWVSYPPLPF